MWQKLHSFSFTRNTVQNLNMNLCFNTFILISFLPKSMTLGWKWQETDQRVRTQTWRATINSDKTWAYLSKHKAVQRDAHRPYVQSLRRQVHYQSYSLGERLATYISGIVSLHLLFISSASRHSYGRGNISGFGIINIKNWLDLALSTFLWTHPIFQSRFYE
jgi:hypothetical protein